MWGQEGERMAQNQAEVISELYIQYPLQTLINQNAKAKARENIK